MQHLDVGGLGVRRDEAQDSAGRVVIYVLAGGVGGMDLSLRLLQTRVP